MKTRIHVNQHNIRANSKNYKIYSKPVFTVKDYKENRKGYAVTILDKNGLSVGKFVYSPDKPLACGAKVWFETKNKVIVRETE